MRLQVREFLNSKDAFKYGIIIGDYLIKNIISKKNSENKDSDIDNKTTDDKKK